ncbi:MAG: MBL fold metallo-hydrolase [Oscillochloris sp.]|nr:MBL fold metallo-hydrolase [Oscillochloris sp.]
MGFTVTSLASGSSGNALLVERAGQALLIDCGVALRTIDQLLRYRGVAPDSIRALLLTHEHGDHTLSAAALARRYGVPIVCNAATHAALGCDIAGLVEVLPVGERASIAAFDVSSFRVRHDAADAVGYRVSADGATLALAVDLGSWDATTVDALHAADLLVVEANHDRELLRASRYPWALQQRICGPLGHLDNIQCGELLARSGVCSDQEVWLAHLSEQTNSARQAVAGVRRVLEIAGQPNVSLRALPRRSLNAPGGAPMWQSDTRLLQQRMF